jgi:hypothetical protein
MYMKVKSRHLLISTILILMFFNLCNAQKRIRLTNVNSKNEFYLTEGRRVVCVLKDGKTIIGTLSKVGDEQITVANQTLNIADLSGIGKKNKGSGFGVFVLGVLGGGLIGSSLRPSSDPCPSCQTAPGSDNGSSGKAFGLLAGFTLAGLSIFKAVRNSPKDLTTKWHLDIVN